VTSPDKESAAGACGAYPSPAALRVGLSHKGRGDHALALRASDASHVFAACLIASRMRT